MQEKKYLSIVSHYETCLERYGDTHLGVDWPKAEDVEKRYRVMLEVIKRAIPDDIVSLLDFGCGAAHLKEYMVAHDVKGVAYTGLDLSEKFVSLASKKFPTDRFYCVDVLEEPTAIPSFDYVVMNGVFTEKKDLSFAEMFAYFRRLIVQMFAKANVGIAFNIMSKHVDWEREDLFHMPFDTLADFLITEVSRNFVMRNDYGLYEYTTYVYK